MFQEGFMWSKKVVIVKINIKGILWREKEIEKCFLLWVEVGLEDVGDCGSFVRGRWFLYIFVS